MMTNSYAELIDRYAAGPATLEQLVAGLSPEQLTARPVAGRWSTLEVVSHIADFEPIFIDRIKRVIAEESPPIRGGDQDLFFERLKYPHRELQAELLLIRACRLHLVTILRNTTDAEFSRVGVHDELGAVPAADLLEKVTQHLEHHLPFLAEKRLALGIPSTQVV